MKVAWFSCGATSAVACKLALNKYDDVKIVYIETNSHHLDNKRFINDCEKWYRQKIEIIKSNYEGVFDVIRRTRFINSARGASCTSRLKINVRKQYEYEHPEITHYIWGFEATIKEKARANRMNERYPEYTHLFPLIDEQYDKTYCLGLLERAGIEIPAMYQLGYNNNNCIGCVKGGMGYWNKIRKDFPDVFNEMSNVEREIGHSALKDYFLDELPIDAGSKTKELIPDCGIFCTTI